MLSLICDACGTAYRLMLGSAVSVRAMQRWLSDEPGRCFVCQHVVGFDPLAIDPAPSATPAEARPEAPGVEVVPPVPPLPPVEARPARAPAG